MVVNARDLDDESVNMDRTAGSTGGEARKVRLKILIYGINFAPELTGVGKYTGEMAAWLAAAGHEVRVITAPPYYPDWSVGNGHRADRYALGELEGVRVRRVPLYVPRRPSGIKRLLHLASFALTSLPSVFRQAFWLPDVVWVVQPTLFCTPAALLLGQVVNAKVWLHIQDFEVNAGFDLGMLKGSVLRKVVLSMETWLLRRFDSVSTISEGMVALAQAKGVRTPVVSFPNWVDTSFIHPLSRSSVFRKRLGIAEDAIVLLYSGNMGAKQGLSQLSSAARDLGGDNRLVFVFCGEGSYRAEMQAQCKSLANVRFLGLQPLQELNELLGMADIHLLPQKSGASELVMPSKLTGMLASGRPVIATALNGTSLARAVEGCGLAVRPDDQSALVEAIRALADDAGLRQSLGRQARLRAESTLSIGAILKDFETRLIALCNSAVGPARGQEIAAPVDVRPGLVDRLDSGAARSLTDLGIANPSEAK
jgi:colanic acid biosynthesis glycosyl transferase WcaI